MVRGSMVAAATPESRGSNSFGQPQPLSEFKEKNLRKILATTLAGGLLAAGSLLIPAHATTTPCGDTTSQAVDANGNPTGGDTLTTLPDGGVVYGAQNASGTGGYIGVTGGHGYIEASGDATSGGGVDGNSNDAPVNGHAFVSPAGPNICLNGTPVP